MRLGVELPAWEEAAAATATAAAMGIPMGKAGRETADPPEEDGSGGAGCEKTTGERRVEVEEKQKGTAQELCKMQ